MYILNTGKPFIFTNIILEVQRSTYGIFVRNGTMLFQGS